MHVAAVAFGDNVPLRLGAVFLANQLWCDPTFPVPGYRDALAQFVTHCLVRAPEGGMGAPTPPGTPDLDFAWAFPQLSGALGK